MTWGKTIFFGQMDRRLTNTIVPPVGYELSYTGSSQAVCSAGAVLSGSFRYRESGTTTWVRNPPTKTQRGTYTIEWRVTGWDSTTYKDPVPSSGTITARIT